MVGPEVLTPDGFTLHYHPAEKKKYNETIVFVHHMWGSHKTTWRHFQFFNEKGFDCVSFDLLLGSDLNKHQWHSEIKYLYKGVFYVWTRQIRSILNAVKGDKILFAFSGPSLSALWAAEKRTDIKKVICDGGPFHDIYENSRNFFYEEVGVRNTLLNKITAFLGTAIWGYKPLTKLHRVLSLWPKNIPILSIRGTEDHIVALESIQKVFKPHPNLDLNVLEIKYGKHLDGMRDFPDQYKSTALPFIKKDLGILNTTTKDSHRG